MKSILFIAFLALATIGCDTPENSTGSDTSSDTAMSQPSEMGSDTAATVPVDTTSTTPNPTDTTQLK